MAKILEIEQSTIRYLIFKKKIPHIKVGRAIRFCPEDIQAWLETNKRGR